MFSWATSKLEQLSQAVAPPPTDAVSRYNYCVQQGDEEGAMGCLAEFDPLTTVIQPTKGTLPIHLACEHAMVRLIRRIMAIPGANIQVVDLSGNSPLHCACLSSSSNAVNVVRMLVTEYQASVVVRNAQKMTPYEVATLNSIRQYLLPLQLQQETQQALDNGGVGLPPGIDMGGLRINNSTLAPPPINVGGGPGAATMAANGTPPPWAGQMFATPSPSHNQSAPQYVRSNSLPPDQPQQQAVSKPPMPAKAPSSDNRTSSEDSKYAMQGHSSAAILASARFRPDGFHSSSSDVNLQRKYGHSITPPSSGGAPVPPPPPSSGNSATAGGAGGPNPFAAGATALGGAGRRGRYPVYTATPPGSAGSTPPYSGGYGYGAGAPHSAGPAVATPSYAVFAPSSGGQPQLQQQQHPSGIPSAPSPTAASNPTSPYMPPPPYQAQTQQPMMHQPQYPQVPAQPQYQQQAPMQPQYQQQAPMQPQYQQQAPMQLQPVALAPPAMPTRTSMGSTPTISTDSAATAEELFAQPSPFATTSSVKHEAEATEVASTDPASTVEEMSSGNAVEPLGAPTMSPMNGVAMAEPTDSASGITKTDNAADFFGTAPQAEASTNKEEPQLAATEEPSALETVTPEVSSATPTNETTTDVGDEPLEEVSLSPPPKETGNGSAHTSSTSAEPAAAQPEALFSMPPPPFSARQ